MPQAYVANLDRVAADAFDAETILVHFEQGTYFSLRGAASTVWSLLANGAGASADQLATAFRAPQGTGEDEIRAGIERLIGQLREADLIRPAPEPVPDSLPVASLTAYEPPLMEAYSDLKELIAIDPVHEVDEAAGWPVRPPTFGL